MSTETIAFEESLSRNLEETSSAIRSLQTSRTIGFRFGTDTESDYTQAFTVPIQFLGCELHGFFDIDGKKVDARIGIKYKNRFGISDHYEINDELNICPTEFDHGRIDLPLCPTEFHFERNSDVIFGIKRDNRAYPLLLSDKTPKGIEFQCIYRNQTEDNKFRIGEVRQRNFKDSEFDRFLNESQMYRNRKVSIESECIPRVNWLDPKDIIRYLNEFVIGQDHAKRTVAVAFSNYMTRLKENDESLPKENIMFVGPSGVGKSYMMHLLARGAALPMAKTTLTGKSSEGFYGDNLSTVFWQLIDRIGTGEKAPYGIIFLDELDKLAIREGPYFFGHRLQEEMINWLSSEGNTITLQRGVGNSKIHVSIDTENLLFVAAGAFHGQGGSSLEEIIKKRIEGPRRVGYGKKYKELDKSNLLHNVEERDLIEYGIKRELVGRFQAIATLDHLTPQNLVSILTESKESVLKSYIRLLSIRTGKRSVNITPAARRTIVESCPTETGARALNTKCKKLFDPLLLEPEIYFQDEANSIKIDKKLAESILRG
jgi:ATP-dependent Clp protease ATP-binding subunit ClpX